MPNFLSFSRFQIEGLRGVYNVDAEIKNNTLIIVGENGSGKTTFLRILFYFLSGRWGSLAQFDFVKVTATIDGKPYSISRKDIEATVPTIDERTLRSLPPSQRRIIRELLAEGSSEQAAVLLSETSRRFRTAELPFESPNQVAIDLKEQLANTLGAQILYLPTYRRIERELSSIFQGIDPDDAMRSTRIVRPQENSNDYVELVEFGMNDVQKAIKDTLDEIREFQLIGVTQLSLSYLGDVVGQSYLSTDGNVIENASTETIDAVLNRIDGKILSLEHKSHLRDIIVSSKTQQSVPSEHEKIIYHYFTKLVKFQEDLQGKELNINIFCSLCSQYIIDKKFIYESGKFSFRIETPKREVKLSELSSGEKQIVSLFSHLYLSGRERFFVLIDEPELSLSVPWQRRFLVDIRDASLCSGLIAVTHSPFIYDNTLRGNTHALGQFISGPDWGNIQ